MLEDAQSAAENARLAYQYEMGDLLCIALTERTDGRIVSRADEVETGQGTRLDLLLRLEAAGETFNIAVETLRHAYPRDIQGAVWRLEEYKLAAGPDKEIIPMVAAEALSPGAREQLRSRGIAYFERNGNLHLRRHHWWFDIERPPLTTAKREATTLFTDAREMVVHALLMHRGEWLTGSELARISQSSQYTCSLVLQDLERREWCESSGAGRTLRRRLTQPRKLLDAWAEQWTKRKEQRHRYYVFTQNPNNLIFDLSAQADKSGTGFPWAFTGTAAANDFAPLLTSVDTAEIIVPPNHVQELVEALRLKPASKGHNVTLIERTGASFMFSEVHPLYEAHSASPFILYLDLLDGRGRNKELAAHVLEKLEI
ncbi:type IV toxin-antitoxin system AbiEi family antitoxin [Ralstonia pickettii]|nr:type IV toxin-antitoxin system AbiEi family antitoxin [Ralstonia pickettii]